MQASKRVASKQAKLAHYSVVNGGKRPLRYGVPVFGVFHHSYRPDTQFLTRPSRRKVGFLPSRACARYQFGQTAR